MADQNKERERDELHRAIWAIANGLRGAVDGWTFMSYVLGMMFYRYISENITQYVNEQQQGAGFKDFNYVNFSDDASLVAREALIQTKGFFIKPSELFCNVHAKAAQDENLNITLENVFRHIEESAQGTQSEQNFSGLFEDLDLNSNKLGSSVIQRNKMLVKLMDGIASMNLGNYQDHSIDAFGDAYEFLIGMYASKAGKSGGEFFTPQEVSELLTRIAVVGKTSVNKVYDPACGSGSLLLKAAKILGRANVRQGFYGQEINLTTYNLCRINMFLHDIEFDKFDIAHGDTLMDPQHRDDEPFEVIVSNPPYSIEWEGDDNTTLINDPRFAPAGVLAPKSKADFAFIMHSLTWLATNGTASIVCFPGILYRDQGKAEKQIRQYLIEHNFVDAIIQLPDNLFYGSTIATCIMVLKKNKSNSDIFFIDASEECVKVGNKNKMTSDNIAHIMEAIESRKDIPHFAQLVSQDQVQENDYNLTVSSYVTPKDTRGKVDIVQLNAQIRDIVAKEQQLRDEIDRIIAEIEGDAPIPQSQVTQHQATFNI
jgi:type I restriction enzyme M protein